MKPSLKRILSPLVKTLYFGALALLLLLSLTAFLIGTKPGLHAILEFSDLYLPGTLKVQEIDGSLLNFSMKGVGYKDDSLELKVEQLKGQWDLHSWKESQLVNIHWQNLHYFKTKEHVLASKHGTITLSGILPQVQINCNSQVSTVFEDNWLLEAKIDGTWPWQWDVNAQLRQPAAPSLQQSSFYTTFSATAKIIAKDKGDLTLNISPGFYHLPENEHIKTLSFKGGTIKANLSPQRLKGIGSLAIDETKNLKLNFSLPKFNLNKGFTDNQSLYGKLALELHSLDFIQQLSSELSTLKGQLTASLIAKGTAKKVNIESQLVLSKSSLSLKKLGIELNALEMKIQSKNQSWSAQGAVESSGQHLSLTGKGIVSPKLSGDLSLSGDNFPIIQTSEYKIHISPKLDLHFKPGIQSLSGLVLIPYAEIKPRSFNNSVSLSNDVVYKREEKSTPSSNLLHNIDVTIQMGEDVALDIKGLKGYLDGSLQMKQSLQSALTAYGELSISEGTYKAYGKNFKIKTGQLLFAGTPYNPGINLRATKKISMNSSNLTTSNKLFDFSSDDKNLKFGETMVLGVEATGRLMRPKIQLFSQPASLSQADILSMLIFGSPVGETSKASLLMTALSSMNLGSDTNNLQFLNQLKKSAGVDFNVQSNTKYNLTTNEKIESTSVVLGKSLSKRLYLSYNIGLSQKDPNLLTLKYLLNRFFSIQISTSDTASAIDLLYTSKKKNKKKKRKE